MKVVDMHCDTIGELWKAEKAGKPISLRSNSLHIDLEKMQKGDYLLQNISPCSCSWAERRTRW